MTGIRTAESRVRPDTLQGYAPEPTLADLLRLVLRAWKHWTAGAALGIFTALLFLWAAVPHYRAEMLVGPAGRASSGPDIKAILPDNSSFAVQYLLHSLGSSDSTDFARFEQTLRGPAVAAGVLSDKTVPYALAKDRRLRFTGEEERPDTPEKLSVYLRRHIDIEPVGTTPLRRLVYTHPDRDFAVRFLATIAQEADAVIKREIQARADSRAAYLEQALAETRNPEHRQAITALLMEQEHVKMILAIDEPFAAAVAEPAFALPRPVWPRKAIVLPLMAAAGAFLGMVLYGLTRSDGARAA